MNVIRHASTSFVFCEHVHTDSKCCAVFPLHVRPALIHSRHLGDVKVS